MCSDRLGFGVIYPAPTFQEPLIFTIMARRLVSSQCCNTWFSRRSVSANNRYLPDINGVCRDSDQTFGQANSAYIGANALQLRDTLGDLDGIRDNRALSTQRNQWVCSALCLLRRCSTTAHCAAVHHGSLAPPGNRSGNSRPDLWLSPAPIRDTRRYASAKTAVSGFINGLCCFSTPRYQTSMSHTDDATVPAAIITCNGAHVRKIAMSLSFTSGYRDRYHYLEASCNKLARILLR